MVEVDWGISEPPLVLIEGQLAAPQSPAVMDDLPEVGAALNAGWYLAPDQPLLLFLPAVWPRSARAWMPDRSTHYKTGGCTGQPSRRLPWSPEDTAEMEADVNGDLRRCRIPARPPNRLWLLKPPPGYPDLDQVIGHVLRTAWQEGVEQRSSAALVAVVARELDYLFSSGTTTSRA